MVWSPRLKDSLSYAGVVAVALAGGFAGGPLGIGLVVVAVGLAAVLVYDLRATADRAGDCLAETMACERQARLLSEAATALLASAAPAAKTLAPRMERALDGVGARLELCHAPSPRDGEAALPLRMDGGTGWLYVQREGPLTRDEAERLQRGLADLMRAAQERTRVTEASIDAEATRRAEMTRTSILHAISHDLRGPLSSVAEAAAALGRAEVDPEERTQLAGVVCDETAHLARMVDDLLDLSRIEAGALNPRAEWIDLNDLVAQALQSVRAQRGAFPIRLELPRDLPAVRGDVVQLHRVFQNLIDNAAKFSPAGEPVEIRGASANGRVTIRVVDHGRGIPPAQQAQVFRPFVRGRDEQGSGLGLAICRGFVEANGGRITLQSRGRTGSAFAVSFPTAPQPSPVAR